MVAPSRPPEAAVTVSGVRKIFQSPDGRQTEALRQASLSVEPGEFISLVGPSGCGKSTLLRIIAGLESTSAGAVQIAGKPVNGPATEVGFVFQDPNLFPWLSVRKNVLFGPHLHHLQKQRRAEADSLIERIGLGAFANALPHHLSGGMAQRVALARALMNHPSVLLLDEPLGALDAFTRMTMQDEISTLVKQRGTTVLLVTHDIDEAIYLSDRIFIFSPRPGRIEHAFTVSGKHPRNRASAEFLALRSRVLELMHFAPAHEEVSPAI